jgi:hypothetical protein
MVGEVALENFSNALVLLTELQYLSPIIQMVLKVATLPMLMKVEDITS